MQADLVETRAKLAESERELAAEVTPKGATMSAEVTNSLEDAVRMLLVTLHSCQLPQQASEAAQTIVDLLPKSPGPMEVEEMSVDRGASADDPVPAQALDWTKRELEVIEDSDAALLTWAKRLKAASYRTAPY